MSDKSKAASLAHWVVLMLLVLGPSLCWASNLPITNGPQSRVETVGEHMAFSVAVNAPASYFWSTNGVLIQGATNSWYDVTNIQLSSACTYTVLASNSTGTATASATLTVLSAPPILFASNVVIARVGDGSQTLSASGNTIYLDQYQTNGSYVSTLMVPDSGPRALVASGYGSDALYETMLTRSSNQNFVNLAGFNVSLPHTGNVATSTLRGIGALSGVGFYSLCLSNSGLYSTTGEFRSAFSTDGLTNFWTTGVTTTGPALDYIAVHGTGVYSVAGATNVRIAGLVGANLGFTEDRSGAIGLAEVAGAPVTTVTSNLFLSDSSGNPVDFAVSPSVQTVYISDANATNSRGGIERWDVTAGTWKKSYTLTTGAGSTVGTSGLTVDFSHFVSASPLSIGAVIYATTAETNANRLIRIVDTGTNSAATALVVAEPNQILRGVRFAPVSIPISIVTAPVEVLRTPGESASFSVTATGSAPISYQWQFNGASIAGATLSTFSISDVQPGNGGVYSVVVSNPVSSFDPGAALIVDTNGSYVPVGVNTSPLPTNQTPTANAFTLVGDGSGIGGTNDQFQGISVPTNGNFDLSVCVASLGLSDVFAEAGLMARQSLAPGSPFAATLATPSMTGMLFDSRATTNGAASFTGQLPVNYPNTWLRLNRMGNVFSGYGSYDGQTWTLLGSVTIAMTDPIYVGLVVSSRNTNTLDNAQFSNLTGVAPNAVVEPSSYPHEPIGPSSRKTGIVFSEIMYKPVARADTNNCEFIELYNSQPWFHDISGYQITCADMQYTFPAGTTIPGGGYLVVAASPGSIQSVYGITNVIGPYTSSLKKSETLELIDEQGAVLLTVPYSNTFPWPVAADGTGHSIILANPTYGEGDPRAWSISDAVGGSPGILDPYTPSSLRNVVINEWLAGGSQFIELYNHSAQSVDVSGCILTDDPSSNEFVIPSGTVLGPGAFVSFNQAQFGFSLNPAGETLYFIKPDGSRMLDAVQFEGQVPGVSYGRWPDGANDFYPLTTQTPGTNNSSIVIGDIVINELMYDPISGNDDDQYIELYNQGTNPVRLANWQFTAGVTFTFPTNAVIPAYGYVVVGNDVANLFGKYTNLNSGNTFGNYNGKLSHNGERVALAMPQTISGTTVYVVEDEVTYRTGGRWGQWSGGGGSSLELINPRSNHRLAANWADSDETQKSSWVQIQTTGVLDNGANYDATIDHAQIGILDEGECLVDNIQVLFNGVNYVANSGFETGLTGWTLEGDHVRSSLQTGGYQGNYSLHLRCSDKFWTGDNSCVGALNANSMASGSTVTLSLEARWLHGWPEALLRLSGNWLEAAGAMPVPQNLGTPGAPNSTYVSNAGPAIYFVTHTPSLPAANQPAVVTAQVNDLDGAQSLTLNYRIDPSTNYISVPMFDTGSNGDALAGDGIFSATIPGQAANVIAAFYISATDNLGATTRFPALRPGNNEIPRECLVMFGDTVPGGSFGSYHLWISQTNVNRWIALSDLANEPNDCTFVNDTRVIYNVSGQYSGSAYSQTYTSPVGVACEYKWTFPDDDQLLGATDFDKIRQPDGGTSADLSLQREEIAFTYLRALGVPWLYHRKVNVFVNGNRRGMIMEDTQVPNSDVVKEYFPNDDDGFLYKLNPWFEFAAAPSGISIAYVNESWSTLMPFTTTGGAMKTARYRYNFEIRRTPDSYSDFTNVYSLVKAANSYGTANYVKNMENIANMENVVRVFAASHAVEDWDVYGVSQGQNIYGYIGAQGTKYSLLMWDFKTVLGNSNAVYHSWAPGINLFYPLGNDPDTYDIYNCPTFRRMYWRDLQTLVSGPFSAASTAPLADVKYSVFINNGLSPENPNLNIFPWISQAQASIIAQLAAVNATNFAVSPTVSISNDVAYISGTAPVNVDTMLFNGVAWPVTWTTLTNWTVAVPLLAGANQLAIQAVGVNGQPISGDTGAVTANYPGATPLPVGHVVINEIMYNPPDSSGQYVELYNNSTNYTFDLSGWQFQGLSYTFPVGSSIGPRSFLILAENGADFASLYGATSPVFDTFAWPLPTNGPTTLSLVEPGAGGSNNITVAEVQFDSAPPWPAGANGLGSSLQLIDPTNDNWRVGNWSGNYPPAALSPGGTNTTLQSFPAFPSLWINEIQADNIHTITNSAGQYAPWIEIYNPSSNTVSLAGLYLADSYSDLTNWAFPSDSIIGPGQFELVFADGETNLSTGSEFHAGFVLPSSSGSVALSRVYNGQPQILDYINYNNLPPGYSYGSLPDGQSFNRQEFFIPTPGGPNNNSSPSAIPYFALNSLYTQNFDSLPDPGAVTVDSDNPVVINGVTYSVANPLNFAAPVLSSDLGGLGLSATMSGWFGTAADSMKVGASAGDQSTGGIISFGATSDTQTNRALGLLATSSTGPTAFGLSFLNETTNTINEMSVSFIGELWRQQPSGKTLSFSYYIDLTGTNAFSTNATMPLHNLDVNFLTGSYSPEDGTQPANQVALSVSNEPITSWPPGAAVWLVWQMTNSSGNSQGLAIDNFAFSANSTLQPPAITQQPQSQAVNSGNNPSFTVGVSSQLPVTYQWQTDGTNIPGATRSTLALYDVGPSSQGSYDVIVSNFYGAALSRPAQLIVNLVTGVPIVNLEPQSQTVYVGSMASFAVTASGTPPLTYQWKFNGANIFGATGTSLVLTNVNYTDQGPYTVLISDDAGSTASAPATLTVVAMPPSVQTQPAPQTVPAGSTAVFSVTATGTAPLNYQWFFDNTPLTDSATYTGSATSTLTVDNVQSPQAGNYSVVVSNSGGFATSQPAVLALVAPSYLAYTNAGAVYTQNLDSLPDPGDATVNTANPVTINGVTYGLTNPVDFAYPVEPANGGFGLAATMSGWYGWAGVAMKAGASAGDQTTGGIISFGPTTSLSTNRSLGLLATSTSGATAFGLRILNQTGSLLTNINLGFTGELWRQQSSPKTLSVSYYVDLSGTADFSPNQVTGELSNLDVNFPTGSSASGTSGPLMTSYLAVTNQPIDSCPPGAVLWLTWQMGSDASSSQGLGIDNLTFSANGVPASLMVGESNGLLQISWPSWLPGYVLQHNDTDLSQFSQWINYTGSISTNLQWDIVNVPITNKNQFFRLAPAAND
ncbi:MAG TPA: lamin tail domain-containing protein [Verrucomicrobiae bacterium]|nr:lamin tail domain-containing protein [Verrucomicrobiae bacterium]